MRPIPDSIHVYHFKNLDWEDITPFVIGDIQIEWGFGEDSPSTRIADIGLMKFKLNNSQGQFDALDRNFIKLIITFDGDDYIRFYGQVTEIKLKPEIKKMKTVEVTVSDWLDQLTRVPLNKIKNPEKRLNLIYRTGKRSDEVISYIIQTAPILPQNTQIETGKHTFPSIFDTLDDSTYAYSELSKVALSELGYIYLRKDRVFGETLVFENMTHREGAVTATPIPRPNSDSGRILLETGDFLLTEENHFFRLNEIQDFILDNFMMDLTLGYGDSFNQVIFKVYPKKVDTTPVVLFSLESPIKIASGERLTIKGSYKNPYSGTRITGKEMIPPESTTDYLMNSKEDGTGTNLTSYLEVSAEYGTSEVVFTLKNNYSGTGFIRKLNARGYGIYTYDSIESVAEDDASSQIYGYKTLQIDQPYQSNLDFASLYCQSLLYEYKNPRVEIQEVSFLANTDISLLLAALSLDIGDVIRIKNDSLNIDKPFRLQKIELTIGPGSKIIQTKWHVKVIHQLNLIPLLFQGEGFKQGVNFGYLPHTVNLNQRSFCIWVNLMEYDCALISVFSDEAGTSLRLDANGKIRFYEKGEGAPGIWLSTVSVPLNDWHFIAVTRDGVTPSDIPKMYLDGNEVSLTQDWAQVGNLKDSTGCITMIGNISTATIDYIFETNGQITDARIYNQSLTAAEVYTLYQAGMGGEAVREGLVFHAPFVLDTENYGFPWKGGIFDRVYRVLGTYHETISMFGGGI